MYRNFRVWSNLIPCVECVVDVPKFFKIKTPDFLVSELSRKTAEGTHFFAGLSLTRAFGNVERGFAHDFVQSRMRVEASGQVFGRSAELHRDDDFT